MTDKPHLSHSQLEMLARCPKQWEFRYVYGIKTPPGVAMLIGKGPHASSEADYKQKMAWGSLMELEEVKDACADGFNRAWDKEPPVVTDRDLDRGQALDMAVSLAELHHREIAPTLLPIAVEQAFVIEVPELPYDIVGVVDVETAGSVRDLKTKNKAPASNAASRNVQLCIYHLRSTLAGTPHKTVALDFLVKTKVPKVVSVEATFDATDHVVFTRRLEVAAQVIQSGVFAPTNTDNWACSERFCGYWNRCEFGSRKSVSVALVDPARLTTRLIPHPHDDSAEETVEEGW